MKTKCEWCRKPVKEMGILNRRTIKNKIWHLCGKCRKNWIFEIKTCEECGTKYPVLESEECPVCFELAKMRGFKWIK